jgi:hypothetical protein
MTTCAVAAESAASVRPLPTGATLRRLPWRAIVVAVFAALAATELVLAWPYVPRALSRLADPNPSWLSLAVVAELVSMQGFATVQQRMLAAGGPRMSTCRMLGLTYAANAVNAVLPGGSALSAGYALRRLRTWGASVPVASGLLSTTSFALLVVACIVLAGSGAISAIPVLITVAALAVVAVLVHRHGLSGVLTPLGPRGYFGATTARDTCCLRMRHEDLGPRNIIPGWSSDWHAPHGFSRRPRSSWVPIVAARFRGTARAASASRGLRLRRGQVARGRPVA